MPRITVGTENNAPIEIHYEDHGSGDPVVMVHGYPLNGNSWERQERELLARGFRVITYDRRGFGRSSQPTVGYDYNTFAADLNDLLEQLDLSDVVLVGFSMGSGEVTRYLGTYGSSRVRKAALLGAIPPFLLKTDDNPEGVDRQVFEDIKAAIVQDRYAYFKDFLDNFYNVDKLMPDRISEPAWQASFDVAAGSSPFATYACVDTWLTDFRRDLPKIDVPGAGRPRHGGPDPPVRGDRGAAAGAARRQSSWSRSRAARTTSPGRIRTRSTGRCSSSSALRWPPDADGSPPRHRRGRRRRRLRGLRGRRRSSARATSTSRSSTARTTTSSSRCSTRWRRGSSRRARSHRRSGDPAQAQERPRRAGRGHRLRSRESNGRRRPAAGNGAHVALRQPDRRRGIDDLVLRTRRARRALAPDEDDRRRPQPATADLRGVRAGRDGAVGSRAPEVAHLRRRRRRADRLRGRGTDRRARAPDARAGLPCDRTREAPWCSSSRPTSRSSAVRRSAVPEGQRGLERMASRSAPTGTGDGRTGIDGDGMDVESPSGQERVATHTVVWAAGVQASPLARILADASGAECDRAGRVAVRPDCTLPGHPEVFVIGDAMTLDGLPGVAAVATQQGIYVARTIRRRLEGKPGEAVQLPRSRQHGRHRSWARDRELPRPALRRVPRLPLLALRPSGAPHGLPQSRRGADLLELGLHRPTRRDQRTFTVEEIGGSDIYGQAPTPAGACAGLTSTTADARTPA